MQNFFLEIHEENKLALQEVEDVDDAVDFGNFVKSKSNEHFSFLFHIKRFNPHKNDESFKKKMEEITRDVDRHRREIIDLIEAKRKEFFKGLSPQRIQQFLQFEADESHAGDECQVCLEEVEVGRLMKELDCGGRHSFCSKCTEQWFAEHNTCPICRHVFK